MAADPWIGHQLGTYQIMDMIGRGGMGDVYRALHPVLERYAAIKFLRADRAGDPALDERFVREARAIARLRHPHVVQLYDFGTYDNGYYMILEFVEGESLYDCIKRLHTGEKRLPLEQSKRIADQIADALIHVHRQGIVHRDIKPANILLNADGDAILADFGIAQLLAEQTQIATGTGTPAYIAPEQAQGLSADQRADLYALAVVLYEILAGRPPFVAADTGTLVLHHIQTPAPPLTQFAPDIPLAVESVLLKALSKSPEERHQNAAAFRSELDRAWRTDTSHTKAPAPPSLLPPSETPPATGNLPFLRTILVGRRFEIDDLKRRLSTSVRTGGELIGLVGLGGVGKTVVALAVAHELAGESAFPDGIFWIDGREHTNLGAILAELVYLLQLELGQEALARQRATVTYHLADRDALVIMDNLETVEQDQTVVEFLGQLSCPVLVTGRVRPAGAWVIELPPLPPDAATRLFHQVSGLAPGKPDEAVANLCTVDLEGHPLAIEVAGALVAAGLDAAELRGYLHEMPLDVLGETANGAGRSVVDALQLSYQRLSTLAQTLLARMSIFAAGFDLSALAALSPEHSRLHQVKGLRELINRSLLEQVSRQRYRLHPITRQFAYALLDDPSPYHRRAGAYFATEAGFDSLAATEQLFLAGDIVQAASLVPAHLDEWINTGQASRASRQLEQFKAVELTTDVWLALREAQGDLLALLGQVDEATTTYQSTLALTDKSSPEQLARIERKIGELVRRQQPAEAISWFEQALAHLNAPDTLEAAQIYFRMSTAWFRQGEYGQALAQAQRGLEIARRINDPVQIAEANINLGNVYDIQGHYDQAIDVYQKALTLLQKEKRRRPVIESVIQSNLALSYLNQGNWEQAISYYEQSLCTEEMLGNLDGIARICFNLGNAYTLRGNFERAEKNLNRCLELWERASSDYGIAATYMNVGLLHLRRGELPESESALTHSRTSFEAIGSNDFMPEVYRLMSEVALLQDRVMLAVEHARRSLSLARQLEARMEEGAAQRALGAALATHGQTQAALEALNDSLAMLTELGHPYEAARARHELGLLYLTRAAVGDRERAAIHLRQALETFTRLGAVPDVTPTQSALVQAELPDQIATTID